MMPLLLLAYKMRESKYAQWDYTALQNREKGEIAKKKNPSWHARHKMIHSYLSGAGILMRLSEIVYVTLL
jgi:hypothetical protein